MQREVKAGRRGSEGGGGEKEWKAVDSGLNLDISLGDQVLYKKIYQTHLVELMLHSIPLLRY